MPTWCWRRAGISRGKLLWEIQSSMCAAPRAGDVSLPLTAIANLNRKLEAVRPAASWLRSWHSRPFSELHSGGFLLRPGQRLWMSNSALTTTYVTRPRKLLPSLPPSPHSEAGNNSRRATIAIVSCDVAVSMDFTNR